jgi:hypothetical protein
MGSTGAAPERSTGAARPQHQTRTRQRVAALLAVVLVGGGVAAAVLANGSEETGDGERIDDRAGIVAIRDDFAGRKLIAARESTRGRPMTMRVATTTGSEWLFTCTGVGPEYVLHQTLDRMNERTAPCDPSARSGDTLSFRFAQAQPGGGDRELQLWLTEGTGRAVVTPSDAVLAAAVYSIPDPVVNLAGADILPIEESEGQEWTYVDGGESRPGARSYTRHFDALDETSILELVMTGSTSSTVRLVVDGETVATVPARYQLGSVQIGDELAGGGAHTVTLEILGTVPADARLAIVQRAGS